MAAEFLVFLLSTGLKCRVNIPSWMPALVTKVLLSFSQSLQLNAGIIPQTGHKGFLL